MGNAILKALDILVKIIDSIPFLKKYRTGILLGIMTILGILDMLTYFNVAHIGSGDLYATVSPYALPLITATALAHDNVKSPTI